MDYYQPVEISVLSAQDLDSVNFLFRPTVYVSVSVTRGSRDQQVTPAAACGKKLLRWNYRMKFYIEDDKVQRNESVFVFQIKCKRFFGSDQVVGKLFVPGCRLGVWGNIRHEPSAPCEDDIYA
ncbi:hypothetical protein CARUB_v10016146mg [Capsella rubella]|uniref:C2 domain-containing protein n=1 Tax=Capsella rubella TaxID=81985 RepID=R0I8J1_9BRAS|nr:uncharacterized protein LOC17890833 [Capsella rubella]EOA32833.1 hypothetical protein CARUB_v10016146mg [Capsella rubella]